MNALWDTCQKKNGVKFVLLWISNYMRNSQQFKYFQTCIKYMYIYLYVMHICMYMNPECCLVVYSVISLGMYVHSNLHWNCSNSLAPKYFEYLHTCEWIISWLGIFPGRGNGNWISKIFENYSLFCISPVKRVIFADLQRKTSHKFIKIKLRNLKERFYFFWNIFYSVWDLRSLLFKEISPLCVFITY